MSKINLESTFGELGKKMSYMTTKMAAQTTLIEEQSKKIENQQRTIEVNCTEISKLSKVVEELCSKIEKLTWELLNNKSKKGMEESAIQLITQSASETGIQNDALQCLNSTERSRRATKRARAKAVPILHKRSDSGIALKRKQDNDLQKLNNNETQEWTLVSKQKKLKNSAMNAVRVGGNAHISAFQAVQKKKFLHVWSLHPNTTEEAILEHVSNISGSTDIKVEKIIPKTKRDYSTFLIGVPESLFDTVNKTESWPLNTQFNEWVWFRNYRKPAQVKENA